MAIESFGTMFSRAILRHLSIHGPTGAADLARELGTDPNTARRTLQGLEDAGLVEADVPAGQRRGRTVTFTVRADRLEHLLDGLKDFLRGR
ncbi:helix-turn-helix domain-containing protein [Paenarthrobacter nitroguajacolicus]|uniref:helix-turn-helix domain-containing protein n=3 Tax=Micrococcaceae TaxID=1268 RepID=UPI003D1EA21D